MKIGLHIKVGIRNYLCKEQFKFKSQARNRLQTVISKLPVVGESLSNPKILHYFKRHHFCLSLAGLLSQILISLYKTGEHWERSHSNWNKLQLIGTTSTGIFSIICLNNAPRCHFNRICNTECSSPQGVLTGTECFVENHKFCKKVSVVDKLL